MSRTSRETQSQSLYSEHPGVAMMQEWVADLASRGTGDSRRLRRGFLQRQRRPPSPSRTLAEGRLDSKNQKR